MLPKLMCRTTVCYVAIMAAKLPVTISVYLKLLTAVRAFVFIDRLSLYKVKMGIPPLVSAFI